MKKHLLILTALLLGFQITSKAQWSPPSGNTDPLTESTYRWGRVGIGLNNPGYLLQIDAKESRDGIRLLSSGPTSSYAYTDLVFEIKDVSHLPAGSAMNWVMNHRKDGYFSGGGASELEFYADRKGGGFFAPLAFKSNGDVVLASSRNAISGRVSIGAVSADAKLHVGLGGPTWTANSWNKAIKINNGNAFQFDANAQKFGIGATDYGGIHQLMFFSTTTENAEHDKPANYHLVIGANGAVGINQINPDAAYKLSVKGKVRADEIKVYTTWPDFVFYDDYKLKPLAEVEQYIKENNHLPEVPSAAQVEKEGIYLGETNALLLKKIEELTLYMIELKKENNELKLVNQTQEQRLKTLESHLQTK